MHKKDLSLDSLQGLICYKHNQPISYLSPIIFIYFSPIISMYFNPMIS